MADFTPINTQEELNAAIGPRLQRERDTVAKEFTAKISELEKTIEDLRTQAETATSAQAASEQQLTEALSKCRAYEADSVKTRIALETGLPYGMAARLNGETEEDIRRDAEALRAMMKPAGGAAPLASSEPAPHSGGTRDQFADWFGTKLGR